MNDIKAKRKYIGYVAIAFFFAIAGSVATQQYIEGITCKDCILDNPTFINTTIAGSVPLNIQLNDVTASRNFGVNYYTTDNPIYYKIFWDNSPSGTSAFLLMWLNTSILIDGLNINTVGVYYNTFTGIIPAHSSYQIQDINGCCIMDYWYEANLTT